MNDLLAARSQMAMSLPFHIIFAAIGVAMPLLAVVAEWKWLRSREDVYLQLAKRGARGRRSSSRSGRCWHSFCCEWHFCQANSKEQSF